MKLGGREGDKKINNERKKWRNKQVPEKHRDTAKSIIQRDQETCVTFLIALAQVHIYNQLENTAMAFTIPVYLWKTVPCVKITV
jgi:hypothetical protein